MTMTISIDDFIQATPAKGRRRSRLPDFGGDIGKLRTQGYSLQQIVDYLEKNGITSSVQTVGSYIRRHIETEQPKRARRNSAKAQP
jgi:hypothetical protein